MGDRKMGVVEKDLVRVNGQTKQKKHGRKKKA